MSQYFYSDATPTPVGPVSEDELRALAGTGTILPSTPVFREGGAEWSTYAALVPPVAPTAVSTNGSARSHTAPPPPPAVAQAPAPTRYFYVDTAGQTAGPVARGELAALKSQGVIRNDTSVIREGDTVWGTYASVVSPIDLAGVTNWVARVMPFMRNPVWYVGGYLIAMLPTYVLPYLGSNSVTARAACALADSMPMYRQSTHSCATVHAALVFHALFLGILIFLAYARGSVIDKKWLVIFPVMATFFDLMPGFSAIPLFPTIMHVLAIILGVVTGSAPARAYDGTGRV